MDLRQQNIIKYSSEILNYLLLFKDKNPDFTFSLRQRDSAQTKDIKRLETGQWFQGSDYIYIPLFKKGDNARKIKTIGFVIGFDNEGNIKKNSIEISFKAGITDEKEISFHRQLAKKFDILFNENNHGEKLFDNHNDIYTNLEFYLNQFRNQALALLEEFGISNKYIISKDEFDKNLNRIENIKKQNSINYWVFQGNPKVFDFETALSEEILTDWTVSAHKEKIKIGDKVILYIGGKNPGCYALAEITSEPYVKKYSADNHLWKDIDKNELKAGIKITHNLVSSPIYKSVIDSYESLKNLKVGSQGTNFSATKEEYETLVNLSGLNFRDLNNETKTNNMSLNQILYGPPGTGKTFTLQNKYFDKFTIKESSLSIEQYLENLVSDLNWWQVISIAVLDLQTSKVNAIHEHEIVKAKEKISDSKTVRPTIWGQLQRHTVLECEYVNVKDRSEPMYFNKDENSNWSMDSELLSQYYPEAFEILNGIKNFTGNEGISIKNYEFITFHQSFSYEDFIEGIKPKLDEGETDLNFEIKDGIFKKLCIKAELDLENNYAIFIDEINRGNVSAIFGELITLIEADKRIGAVNELKVKLPYSKKEFGVPSNLYIIGTMNTADRSVEALDTALRRRFSFVEMMPDEKVISDKKFTDYDRAAIMSLINQRIEVLLDRNYTLGHSYFIKPDFKNSFENEIMPLLQEYFYNDYGKIGLVLGKGFVREKDITAKNDKSIFADFDTKNEVDIIKSYELIPFNEKDFDFDEAIEILLA